MVEKVLLTGLGSIGKRHASNIKSLYGDDVVVGVLRRKSRKHSSLVDVSLYSWEEVEKWEPVIAFITTPTFMHKEDLLRLLEISSIKYIFIEKPVSNKIEDREVLCKLVREKGIVTYVAAPLRYTPVIKFYKLKEDDWKPLQMVRICASSHLPDWREGIDYSKHYSADRALGGGVALELIHEMDYVRYLWGNPVKGIWGNAYVSDLDLRAEDTVFGVFRTDEGILIDYYVDYFSLKPDRFFEVRSTRFFARFDILSQYVYVRDRFSERFLRFEFQRNDMHIEELKHFWKIIRGEIISDNDICNAFDTLGFVFRFYENTL